MNKVGQILSIIAIAAGTFAIVYFGVGTYELANLCYKFLGFNFQSLTDSNGKQKLIGAKWANCQIMIAIKNPSFMKISITGYSLSVAINGTHVSDITSSVPLEIANDSKAILTLPIKIDLGHTTFGLLSSNDIINALATGDYSKINITISGTLSATIAKIPVSTSINITKNLQDIKNSMNEPDTPCETELGKLKSQLSNAV